MTKPIVGLTTILLLIAAAPAGFAAVTTPLLAGQTINVGDVTIWNDADNLYVEYSVNVGDWGLYETHLYVGTTPPSTPAPGQFPYQHEDLDGALGDGYVVPLADLGVAAGDDLFIAAHGVVCQPDGSTTPVTTSTVIGTVTLWAGQNIDAGTVTVSSDGENLTVTYETKDGWELTETHLYAGLVAPTNSAPGQFPYKHEDLGGVTTDTYVIPLAGIAEGLGCGDILYIAAHAALQKLVGYDPDTGEPIYQTETGWGEGDPFGRGWAMSFWVELPCDDPGGGGDLSCETCWAFGPHELRDLPGFPNRWGWYLIYTVE